MLTDAQRETAIQLMNDAYWSVRDRTMADALDALLSEFVVIAKNDVTEEYRLVGEDDGDLVPDVSCYGTLDRCRQEIADDASDPAYDRIWIESRVVSRWEPITTKESDDA